MTVGKSGITPFKQKNVQDIISWSIGKFHGIWRKYKSEPFYNREEYQNIFIDITAGDMDSEQTSPFTFINTLRKFSEFPSKLYLIEKDRDTFQKLLHNIRKLDVATNYNVLSPMFKDDQDLCTIDELYCKIPPEIFLKNMDLCSFLGEFSNTEHKYRYGIIYYDPNGFQIDPYRCLFNFIKNNAKVDVLININVTQIKRNSGVKKIDGFKDYRNVTLRKIISKLNNYKQFIFLRNNFEIEDKLEVKTHTKFILVYGTNYAKCNMPAKFGFVTLESEEGIQLIKKYNYDHEED